MTVHSDRVNRAIRLARATPSLAEDTGKIATLRTAFCPVGRTGTGVRAISVVYRDRNLHCTSARDKGEGILECYGLPQNAVTRGLTDRFEIALADLDALSDDQIMALFNEIGVSRENALGGE